MQLWGWTPGPHAWELSTLPGEPHSQPSIILERLSYSQVNLISTTTVWNAQCLGSQVGLLCLLLKWGKEDPHSVQIILTRVCWLKAHSITAVRVTWSLRSMSKGSKPGLQVGPWAKRACCPHAWDSSDLVQPGGLWPLSKVHKCPKA